MKLPFFSAAAVAVVMAGSAYAQTVVIQPEQETVIREYVTAHPVDPVEITDVEVSVGTVVPETVELHAIEAPDISYSYAVVGNQTLVVEPETREIIHILQ